MACTGELICSCMLGLKSHALCQALETNGQRNIERYEEDDKKFPYDTIRTTHRKFKYPESFADPETSFTLKTNPIEEAMTATTVKTGKSLEFAKTAKTSKTAKILKTSETLEDVPVCAPFII
jgi:hypothetical protein